jgi:hypothetical protein
MVNAAEYIVLPWECKKHSWHDAPLTGRECYSASGGMQEAFLARGPQPREAMRASGFNGRGIYCASVGLQEAFAARCPVTMHMFNAAESYSASVGMQGAFAARCLVDRYVQAVKI